MARLELTISPQVLFMPYLYTSSNEPPCYRYPVPARKWGTILRISSNARPWVAPTTYIMFVSSFAQFCEVRNTLSNRRSPLASSVSWKSCRTFIAGQSKQNNPFAFAEWERSYAVFAHMQGTTMQIDVSNSSRKYWAYIAEVLPISLRLASVVNWSG